MCMAEIINIHERRGTTVEADILRQWIRQCREGMAECEANWMEEGKTFAWFKVGGGADG